VPAVCEELFFRGYALTGFCRLGPLAAVVLTALAFGLHHHSIFRLGVTVSLGLLLGLLVIRCGSVWPAMLAHLLHNGLAVLVTRDDALRPWVARLGYEVGESAPPVPWVLAAAAATAAAVALCWPPRRAAQSDSSMYRTSGSGLS
jgi:membrane protease YdiL (CAAX protease family)